jgi:hypothetical protein
MAMIATLAPTRIRWGGRVGRSKQRIELVASYHALALQTVGSLIRSVSDSWCR